MLANKEPFVNFLLLCIFSRTSEGTKVLLKLGCRRISLIGETTTFLVLPVVLVIPVEFILVKVEEL